MKVSFYLPNGAADTVDTIGAGLYSGVTAGALVQLDNRFTLESFAGDTFLCTNADLNKGALPLTGNNNTYMVLAKPFILVQDEAAPYVGGHPPYVPKPTK